MEAMKKAYAEMILNTAKEAATRVMAAELRARRVEEEFSSGKEESARMLVRLKQILDARTKEAEMASLNQQRKADELESQLNEAEGIILDIRVELNQAWEQLDELKNKNLQLKKHDENAAVCGTKSNDRHSHFDKIKGPEFLWNNSTVVSAFNSSAGTSELAENFHDGKNQDISVIRRSLRKRKLKSWDNYITSSGLQYSQESKKLRKADMQFPFL